MSERYKIWLNKAVTTMLRFGVIMYIFSVLFPFINDPGFEETFWSWSLRWFLIIVQAAATLLIMVIKRSDFLVYGFFIIFLASIYNLFVSAVSSDPFPDLFSHFLAATVSVYFMTRDMRIEISTGHKKHRNRSNSNDGK